MNFRKLTKLLLENDAPTKNKLPVDAIRDYAETNSEFYHEDETFIVIEPKSHESACYYGRNTKSRFCIANPEDSSDWDMLESIRQQMGDPAHFYFVFNKNKSTKNSNSIFGVVVYPKMWSDMAVNMSDEQLIAQGRERFRNTYDGQELSYEDDFLKDWISQIREYNNLFESYNSNNKVILPNDLRAQIGDEIFFSLIRR